MGFRQLLGCDDLFSRSAISVLLAELAEVREPRWVIVHICREPLESVCCQPSRRGQLAAVFLCQAGRLSDLFFGCAHPPFCLGKVGKPFRVLTQGVDEADTATLAQGVDRRQ